MSTGYTYWIASPSMRCRDIISRMNREGYTFGDPDTYIITDDTDNTYSDHRHILDVHMDNIDNSIYSTIVSMGYRTVIRIIGDTSMSMKKTLAVTITRAFNDTICTMIMDPVSVYGNVHRLYDLTSHIIRRVEWSDTSTLAMIPYTIGDVYRHSFIVLRVDRMYGYNYDTPNIASILSHLGMHVLPVPDTLLIIQNT